MTMVSVTFTFMVASVSLVLTTPLATAHAQGTPQQRSACMGDAFRFCGADIPNVARIEACLSQNRSNLTPACAAEFPPRGRTKLRPEHFR